MGGSNKNQVKNRAAAALSADITSRSVNWRGWLNTALLFLTLEIAILSIEQARWITPQPWLTLVLFLSVVTACLLAKSRFPAGAAHVVALAVGGGITLWQLHRLSAPETAAFGAFLVFSTWLVGYVSTWFILRRGNAWVAVCLGAAVILVNLSNLPDGFYFFFGLYFLASVFLIIRTRLANKHCIPAGSRSFKNRGSLQLMASLVCLVVLAVSIAWVVPEVRVPGLRTKIATSMLWKQDIEKSPLNLFAAVPAKQPLNTSNTRRYLLFQERWHQGERVDFVVKSPHPSYWRVNVYDTYTSRGWENSPTSDYILKQNMTRDDAGALAGRSTITYTVTTEIKTDVLLMTGIFVSADTLALVHVRAGDVISVMTPRILSPAEQYTVSASILSTSLIDLSVAGGVYPPSITERYLQLPPDFPQTIRWLSENITREARSPYQKAMAINDYLSRIQYNEKIEAPPKDTDGVEHFLFTQKSGFCVYYASAMAVMLRSVGVPSRLAVGYLPGDPGEVAGEYILRNKHYHAWPQVYFPGYDWIDLEATPGSTDGQVSIETPWISDSATSQPIPEVWDWLDELALLETPVQSDSGGGPLPFADELGKALLIIFAVIATGFILAAPLLAVRSAFYRWLWQADRANLAPLVYSRLCHLAAMVGRGPRIQQTPREFAAGLVADFPEQAKALNKVAQAYVENRFGRREGKLSLFEEAELLKARHSIYNALLKQLSPIKKFTGRWR